MPDSPSPSSPASSDEDALLCPACGYDLRATLSDTCSECGAVVNRADLKISRIPWSRRHEIGRIRAYIKTVWLITIGHKSLVHESTKPHTLRDAMAFRRVTAFLIAAVFIAAFVAIMQISEGLASLTPQQRNVLPINSLPAWVDDLWVPWSAASTTNWIVLPLMLVFFAFHITGVQRRLFKIKNAPPQRQDRATAMAYYSAAPLAWFFPAALIGVALVYLHSNTILVENYLWGIQGGLPTVAKVIVFLGLFWRFMQWLTKSKPRIWVVPCALVFGTFVYILFLTVSSSGGGGPVISIGGALPAMGALIAATFGTPVRVAEWSARVRHSGLERAMLDIPHLLALWLFGAVILFGFLSWCIGFIWLVIDSFR